ncbi:predicted protein [Streptomyces sp. SPB78]|nr:predicted protein [Streptomyces sp. SPB78]
MRGHGAWWTSAPGGPPGEHPPGVDAVAGQDAGGELLADLRAFQGAGDGAVGAVVINVAREAVWACYFDDGTCAPEEIPLPEDLQNVPAPGEEAHNDWLYRWEQHITRLL